MQTKQEFERLNDLNQSAKRVFIVPEIWNPQEHDFTNNIRKQINATVDKIQNSRRGINLERIVNLPTCKILSARMDMHDGNRLLLMPFKNNHYVIIGVVLHHRYDKNKYIVTPKLAKFLSSEIAEYDFTSDNTLDFFQNASWQALESEDNTQIDADTNAEQTDFDIQDLNTGYLYNGHVVQLMSQQGEAIHHATHGQLPMVISGGPGSGKTLSAYRILIEYIKNYGQQVTVSYLGPQALVNKLNDELTKSPDLAELSYSYTVHAITHETLFERLAPENITAKPRSNAKHCIEWLENRITNIARTTPTTLSTESAILNKIYQEFKIISGYQNNFEQYQELGKKQSHFSDHDERTLLFQLFHEYMQQPEVDHELYFIENITPQSDLVIVDEMQIASSAQLNTAIKLAKYNKILFVGDEEQNPDGPIPACCYLDLYFHNLGVQLNKQTLLYDARSSLLTSRFAEYAHKLKDHITKNKTYSPYREMPSTISYGGVYWEANITEELIQEYQAKTNTDCLIITHENYKDEAKLRFGENALITTPAAGLGIEASEVVLYKFFNTEVATAISQLLNARNKKTNFDSLAIEAFFAKMRIALTRATHIITIIQPFDANIRLFSEYLKKGISPHQTPRNSNEIVALTEEQWLSRAKHAADTDRELAETILISRLGYDQRQIQTFYRTLQAPKVISNISIFAENKPTAVVSTAEVLEDKPTNISTNESLNNNGSTSQSKVSHAKAKKQKKDKHLKQTQDSSNLKVIVEKPQTSKGSTNKKKTRNKKNAPNQRPVSPNNFFHANTTPTHVTNAEPGLQYNGAFNGAQENDFAIVQLFSDAAYVNILPQIWLLEVDDSRYFDNICSTNEQIKQIIRVVSILSEENRRRFFKALIEVNQDNLSVLEHASTSAKGNLLLCTFIKDYDYFASLLTPDIFARQGQYMSNKTVSFLYHLASNKTILAQNTLLKLIEKNPDIKHYLPWGSNSIDCVALLALLYSSKTTISLCSEIIFNNPTVLFTIDPDSWEKSHTNVSNSPSALYQLVNNYVNKDNFSTLLIEILYALKYSLDFTNISSWFVKYLDECDPAYLLTKNYAGIQIFHQILLKNPEFKQVIDVNWLISIRNTKDPALSRIILLNHNILHDLFENNLQLLENIQVSDWMIPQNQSVSPLSLILIPTSHQFFHQLIFDEKYQGHNRNLKNAITSILVYFVANDLPCILKLLTTSWGTDILSFIKQTMVPQYFLDAIPPQYWYIPFHQEDEHTVSGAYLVFKQALDGNFTKTNVVDLIPPMNQQFYTELNELIFKGQSYTDFLEGYTHPNKEKILRLFENLDLTENSISECKI